MQVPFSVFAVVALSLFCCGSIESFSLVALPPARIRAPKKKFHKHRCPFVVLSRKNDEEQECKGCSIDRTRRTILATSAAVAFVPSVASAGQVGARITKAVTTSDLGISVRTSVVKGAQVMDQLDGKWEKLSDRFGLGAERSKAGSRPAPKVIPDPLPLDISTAQSILEASDRVFLSVSGISAKDLQERVVSIAQKVRLSFERGGVDFPRDGSPLQFATGPQFNFAVYSHFKAYSDLLIEQGITFGPFRTKFESQLGRELVSLLAQPETSSGSKTARLQAALQQIDHFLLVWKTKGLVSLTETTPIDEDRISDWVDDVADLDFNIALDGDITLNSQVLLQEQGFRLYPSFCRYAVSYILDQVSPQDQKVSVLDYYFDTDYNSDPDKFEVNEVLLSVQLENV